MANYPDVGKFAEAWVVVQILSQEMNRGDEILVGDPATVPLHFYLWQLGVPAAQSHPHPPPRKQFIIVQPSVYSLRDLTSEPVEKITAFGDAEIYVRNLPDG